MPNAPSSQPARDRSRATTVALASVVAVVLMLPRTNARADDSDEPKRRHFTLAVEADPLAYIFKGYGGLLATQIGRWRFTAGAFKVGELPSFITNSGSNKGFVQSLSGAALWANYSLSRPDRGWCAGLMLQGREHTYTNDAVPGERFLHKRLDLLPTFGYRWVPFANLGLYVLPWVGVALHLRDNGNVVVGGMVYEPRAIDYFVTFHVGYQFEL